MEHCAWCTAEVAKKGYTCSVKCYVSWYAWASAYAGEGHIVLLETEEEPPLPLKEQPWYEREVTGK